MNSHARSIRVLLCGAILAGLHLRLDGADGLQTPSPAPSTRAGVSGERLVLRGIASIGDKRVASLHDQLSGMAGWHEVGDSVFGYTLREIARDHVVLVRRDTAVELNLPLENPSVVGVKEGPKPYSKAWINSRANPMLLLFQDMPGRLYDNWFKLTDVEKEEIIEFYRKHGWQLTRAKTIGESTDFEWRNIYEAERAAAIKANREAFEKTLSPDQQVLWGQMRGFQKIFPAGPNGFSAEQREFIAARQRTIDDFKQSLSAGQKAEHDTIGDFTKADWK